MSFVDCVRGNINETTDEKLREKVSERLQQYESAKTTLMQEQHLTGELLDLEAGRIVQEAQQDEMIAQKKRLLYQARRQQSLYKDLSGFANAQGENDAGEAAISLLVQHDKAGFANYRAQHRALRGQIHAKMADVISKYAPRKAGIVKPKADIEDLIREMAGVKTGNDGASELAKGVMEGMEYARLQANAAGAHIPKRDGWFYPQNHDALRVAAKGRDEWVGFIESKLDWAKMRDPQGLPIPKDKRIEVLQNVWATIKTGGLDKLDPAQGAGIGAGSVAKRLSQSRFLIFKSSDDFISYHNEFGQGTLFDSIINHLDGIAHNTALMQIFGPDVQAGKRFVEKAVKKLGADLDAADTGMPTKLWTSLNGDKLDVFNAMFAIETGQTTVSAGKSTNRTIASIGANTRNLLTSAMLGSTTLIAAPSDLFMTAFTKRFNKMPAGGTLKSYLRMINPANKADRQLAVRSGLIAESATSMAYGGQRMIGEYVGGYATERITDITLRASLLTPHTEAARWAFGMEFMGAMADYAGRGFDDLPFKDMLERYGFTRQEWEALQATAAYDWKGSPILRANEIKDEALAQKYLAMIHDETEFAVPNSGNSRSRAALMGATKAGTVRGEILRSFAMFKNFPVTMMFTHFRRGLMQDGGASKASYLIKFGLGLTAVGGLSTQLAELSKGREPMNMEDPRFWGAAMLKGGGLAIWGDFLFANLNRYGGGLEQSAAGPVIGGVGDTLNLTVGNAMQFLQGEDTNFGAEALRYTNRNMPANSIFYLRLALQRMIFDQLMEDVDPRAARRFQREQRRYRKQFDQDYWWKPGEVLPK